MKLNPTTFTGLKVEEDPQGFLDEIEKIYRVMQAKNMEDVNFIAYHLKDVAYQWYEEWDRDRVDIEDLSFWDAFFGTFLDRFLPQELRKAKMKNFVNIK